MTNEEILPTKMTDEQRISLIKNAIATDEGWKILAQAVVNSKKPNAKETIIICLKQIAGDKTIPVAVPDVNGSISVKLADFLIQQLENNIALVTKIQET